MSNKKKHIDDVQASTVEDHFRYLVNSDDTINSESSEVELKDLPDWYDEELFRTAQEYYKKNMLSMSLVAVFGLLAVLVIPSILKILIFTKQSGTPCTAYKRYMQTVIHIHTLYVANIHDEKSNWWKTLNTIRWKHSTNSRRSSQNELGGILQRDMALTQFGFIGYALLQAKRLSLTNEPKEREGLNHYWRVIGYLLDIDDRINICRKNEAETTELCKLLLNEIYVKHIMEDREDFCHMAWAFVDGLWTLDVSLNNDAFMHLWYELSGLKYKKPLSTYSWLNMQYRNTVLYLMGVPYLGALVRSGFNYYLTILYWIGENFPIAAWTRFGKSYSMLTMYPKLTNR